MAAVELFTKIKANYDSFTKAERKVADFILAYPQQVLYMSITDLADACSVGDTSVFRFCRTLRLQGYQQFKMLLAQAVNTEEGESLQVAGNISGNDTITDMARKVLSTNVAALNETCELISERKIATAVDYLLSARRVAFFGVGSSFITAMEACNKFLRITDKASCICDSHLQSMTAALLTEQDVAVAISYSGSTKDIVDIAKICRGTGTKVICITRFGKSPLAHYSDLTLLSGANEGPLQGGSLSAKISQLYLLDVLYIEYFRRAGEVAKINKKRTAASVTNKLY